MAVAMVDIFLYPADELLVLLGVAVFIRARLVIIEI